MIRWIWDKMLKWGWDFNRGLRGQPVELASRDIIFRNTEPSIRIGIIPAMNGRALEIGKKIQGRHGDFDWQYSMFLVPDDIPLSEAMATFLLLEGIK